MTILENQEIADIPTLLYMELEDALMRNIAIHCRDWGQPIATDEWLLMKLAEIGKLNRENIRLIGQYSGASWEAIERMLNEAAEDAIGHLEPGFQKLVRQGMLEEAVAVGKSRNIRQVMGGLAAQAKEAANLCNTTMLYKARDVYRKLVTDIAGRAKEIENKPDFLHILNRNTVAMTSGAFSRQQAMIRCIEEFNARGIPAFVDRRGREWSPEAYVNMNLRTTSGNTARGVQFARLDDYKVDLIEVDSHSGARPKCARDQGRIFDRANKSEKYAHWNTSSYGEPDGLFGINCGHHMYPYLEGISIRRYFPTEDMDANNKFYKEIQKQRALERGVRKQKRECMLFKESGNEEGFEKAAVKLAQSRKKLEEYVEGNPKLHRRKNREHVVGFDREISARAAGINRVYTKARNTDKIPLKDTYIRKAVGAKAKNYDILEPDTGKIYHFTEGSKIQNSEVFAGKGTRKPLHEGVPEGLTEQFGGTPSKWQHCKGHGIIDYDGEERPAEVHWFQEETVGKVRFKVKRWEDEG